MVLKNIFQSPSNCKEIKWMHPKENQSRRFIGRTDAEADTPILWPPDAKKWLIWKDPDAGKDLRQEEKEWQRMSWLDGITNSMTWVWTTSDWEPRCATVHEVAKTGTWLSDWTLLNWTVVPCLALAVASWSAYRVLRRQVWWSHTLIYSRISHNLLWPRESKVLG